MIWRNFNSPRQKRLTWQIVMEICHKKSARGGVGIGIEIWLTRAIWPLSLNGRKHSHTANRGETLGLNLTRLNIKTAFQVKFLLLDLCSTNIIRPRLHADSFSRKHNLLNWRKWFQDKDGTAARLNIHHGPGNYNHFLHLYLINLTTSTNHWDG